MKSKLKNHDRVESSSKYTCTSVEQLNQYWINIFVEICKYTVNHHHQHQHTRTHDIFYMETMSIVEAPAVAVANSYSTNHQINTSYRMDWNG